MEYLSRTTEEVQRADETQGPTLLFIQLVVFKLITYPVQQTILSTAGDIDKH